MSAHLSSPNPLQAGANGAASSKELLPLLQSLSAALATPAQGKLGAQTNGAGEERGPVGYAVWGSVKLPIYKCQVRISRRSTQAKIENQSDCAAEAPDKKYVSYVVTYYENGRWRMLRGRTLPKARRKGKKIAKRLAETGSQAITISPADCRIFTQAKEILSKYKLTVDAAARLLDDLLMRLKKGTLSQAVEFFNNHGADLLLEATQRDAYTQYLADLDRKGVGDLHLRDTKKFLVPFVDKFPGKIPAATTPQIQAHLDTMGGGPRNKNNARAAIIALHTFMERKRYLPKGENPAKATTAYGERRVEITTEAEALATLDHVDIYTPAEMRRLLDAGDADERLTLDLKAFSGIRTEELHRFWWVLIVESAGTIKIPRPIAKIGLQRELPILPNLKRRLAEYPAAEKHDKICKQWNSSNTIYHMWKRLADKAHVPYKYNAFRNSYITYRLAQTGDIKLVARESGNSPEMIKRYYLDLATPEQAAEWFDL